MCRSRIIRRASSARVQRESSEDSYLRDIVVRRSISLFGEEVCGFYTRVVRPRERSTMMRAEDLLL